jgi:hypothetical protein
MDYFIQNLIFDCFIEKKRGCVTEGEGEDTFLSPMKYVIGFSFIKDIFFSDISIFGITTNINVNFKNKSWNP